MVKEENLEFEPFYARNSSSSNHLTCCLKQPVGEKHPLYHCGSCKVSYKSMPKKDYTVMVFLT